MGRSHSARGQFIKASPAAETATPPASEGVCVVVLAAGASTRLGQPKQLLPYQGKTLLRHTAEIALSVGPVAVVLGAHAEQIAPTLEGLPIKIVIADDWQEGMAASLRTGITVAGDCDAALVMLCDQPLVTTEFLQALLIEWEPGSIVASDYGEALGPPCIFDRVYFPELLALTGDSGARKLLKKYPCRTVAFPGGRADVDTLTDWQAL